MIKATSKYFKQVGPYKKAQSEKAISLINAAADKKFNVDLTLTEFKVLMNFKDGLSHSDKIVIGAVYENPTLIALGKHKAIVTEKIKRSAEGRIEYEKAFEDSIGKLKDYFTKKEAGLGDLKAEGKSFKNNCIALLKFFNLLSGPTKI